MVQELDAAKGEIQTLQAKALEVEKQAAQEQSDTRAECERQLAQMQASLSVQAEQHTVTVTKMQCQIDECCSRLQEVVTTATDVRSRLLCTSSSLCFIICTVVPPIVLFSDQISIVAKKIQQRRGVICWLWLQRCQRRQCWCRTSKLL